MFFTMWNIFHSNKKQAEENYPNLNKKTVSKDLKDKPWHVEGSDVAEWVLMDYVHIVVHVFQKHIREYYNIESLWGDAKITKIENKY